MKKRIFFLLILLMVCLLNGCGLKPEVNTSINSEEIKSDSQIVVGFSQLGSESVFRTANTKSIQDALTKDKGYFLIYSNARQKQENQIKAIRSFISQRVDYIVFSPVTEYGWDTVLKEARDADIPVILVDRKVQVSDQSLYTTWIGSNMNEEGRKAGKELEKYLRSIGQIDADINILVLRGTEGATATIGRTDGFHEIAQKHTNWHILEEPSGEFTTAKGKEVMHDMLKKYTDIDVIVSQNDDMTFGALEAIKENDEGNGVSPFIISFDAGKEALELLQQGEIDVDIECNPLQGEYVRDIIHNLENGMTVLKSTIVDEMVFTQENVDDYIGERSY